MRLIWLVLLATCLASSACSDKPWTEVKAFDDVFTLNDLWVFGPDNVWVVGSGGAVVRYDGSDWNTIATDTYSEFTGIWGFAPNDVWVVGGETMLHWDGDGWESTDLDAKGVRDASGIFGVAPDDLWIVDNSGIVLHWDGTSLTRTVIPCSSNTAIWGFSSDDLWTQGTFGTCHKQAGTWQEVETGISGGEGDVWGMAPDDVWVVGESDEAAHFDGAAWEVYENYDFIGELSALWGSASDDVWGVGLPGSIAHFNGKNWTEVMHQTIGSPYLRMFNAVHGSSSKDVWAVGAELGANRNCGLVFRYRP